MNKVDIFSFCLKLNISQEKKKLILTLKKLNLQVKKLDINPGAKALIFDLDGTLADTMPIHFLAYKNILVKYGINFTPEVFATLAGIPAVETIKKLNEMYGTAMNAEEIGHFKEREYEK